MSDVGDIDTENAGGGGNDVQYFSIPRLPTEPTHNTKVDISGQSDGHAHAFSVTPQRDMVLPQAHAGRNATSLRLRTVLLAPSFELLADTDAIAKFGRAYAKWYVDSIEFACIGTCETYGACSAKNSITNRNSAAPANFCMFFEFFLFDMFSHDLVQHPT